MSDDDNFESAEVGEGCFPTQAGQLKKGDYVCIKNFPCKIIDISTSKTGKHGHAKANITALDIFTGKKYEEVAPTSHNLPCPFVEKLDYQLVDIGADGILTILDDDCNERNDLNLPPDQELADRIKASYESGKEVTVTVQKALGLEQVVGIKETGNK